MKVLVEILSALGPTVQSYTYINLFADYNVVKVVKEIESMGDKHKVCSILDNDYFALSL